MALSAAIMAGGTILGGILSSRSASDAADSQERANAAAMEEQRRQFDVTRADMMPFLTGGQRAAAALDYELGLGARPQNRLGEAPPPIRRIGGGAQPSGNALERYISPAIQDVSVPQTVPTQFAVGDQRFDTRSDARAYRDGMTPDRAPGDTFDYRGFRATPGYEFRVNEGMDALNSTMAAGGTLGSGRAMRSAMQFGQGIAADEYGTYLNRLAAAAGRGQTQANALGQFGANTATNVGNLMTASGQAQTNAAVNQGNIFAGTLEGLGGIAGRYFGGVPNALAPQTYTPSPFGAGVAPTSSFMRG